MVLQVKKINYSINKIKILDEVSFIVPDNKICAFIGKNGAGKTTVIKSILNLLKTYTGNIMINSISSMDSESRATLSYCPEKEELPNMIIYDFLLEQACYSG
jgi:ABC-type multidrug transport system ATPase subunit